MITLVGRSVCSLVPTQTRPSAGRLFVCWSRVALLVRPMGDTVTLGSRRSSHSTHGRKRSARLWPIRPIQSLMQLVLCLRLALHECGHQLECNMCFASRNATGNQTTKQLGDLCACRQTSLQKAINKQKERNPLLIYSAFCLDHFRSRLKPAEH